MDTARIYRLSISGWLFIFSFVLHFWVIGIHLRGFLESYIQSTQNIIFTFLAAFLATPVLGFVISGIAERILHAIHSYRFHIKIPTNEKELRLYFNALNALYNHNNLDIEFNNIKKFIEENSGNESAFKKITRKHSKTLYIIFNLVRCLKAPDMMTEYTVRRWTLFWTHINSILAIIFGLASAFIFRAYFAYIFKEFYMPFESNKLLFEIPILIYFIVAIWQLLESRKSTIDIEYKWLLQEANKTTNLFIISVKYLENHTLKIVFNDSSEKIIDFAPFIIKSFHPEIKKYLDKDLFKNFSIVNGNLIWNDYDLIFPLENLYEGKI